MIKSWDEFILEKLGLPNVVDKMTDIICDYMISDITDIEKEDLDKDTVEGTDIFYGKREVDLYKDNKWDNFKKTNLYNDLKIDPKITYTIYLYNNYTISAAYSRTKDSIDFTIIIPYDYDITRIEKELKPKISHELLHAYQSNKKNYYGPDEIVDINSKFVAGKRENDISSFIFNLIYISASYEINARISELHKTLQGSKNFMDDIKKTEVWKYYSYLKNFNADEYYNEVIEKYTPDEFDEIIIDWFKELDDTTLIYKQKFGNDIKTPRIPKSNAKQFLKYWEDVFHQKSETWFRKMMKLNGNV